MAEPTVKQRRVWAKLGIAMPDGSYYIRNATDLQNAIDSVGRATPNAGESDVARRNAVRRHIMKRANEMKLSSKIPDTWAPDGSLKQSVAASHVAVDEAFVLEHLASMGMPSTGPMLSPDLGAQAAKQPVEIQSQHDALISTAKEHETIAAAHRAMSQQFVKDAADLIAQRENSPLFKANYGQNAPAEGDTHFYFRTGMSKSVAASQLHTRAMQQAGMFARSATDHEQTARTARSKAADLRRHMQHDAGEQFILAHFGRKGMKWGEHVFGRNHGSGTATVHPDVARARAAQATIRTHGLHALSNNELRDLNKRTQLETDYARLHGHTSEGRKIVEQIAKEQSKALATGYIQRYGPQGVSWLIKNGIKITVGAGRHKA